MIPDGAIINIKVLEALVGIKVHIPLALPHVNIKSRTLLRVWSVDRERHHLLLENSRGDGTEEWGNTYWFYSKDCSIPFSSGFTSYVFLNYWLAHGHCVREADRIRRAA